MKSRSFYVSLHLVKWVRNWASTHDISTGEKCKINVLFISIFDQLKPQKGAHKQHDMTPHDLCYKETHQEELSGHNL